MFYRNLIRFDLKDAIKWNKKRYTFKKDKSIEITYTAYQRDISEWTKTDTTQQGQ